MSAKFLLALIAVNGLFLSANAANATTGSPPASTQHITQLSQTIAINRALLAQKVNQVQVPPPPPMVTAGVPRLPTQTDKQPNSEDKDAMIPTIGSIAIPQDGSNTSTTTDNKRSTSDDKKARPENLTRVGLINNGGSGASKATTTDNKQSTSSDKQPNAEDKKVMPENFFPLGYIKIPKDGSSKLTTTDTKQSTSDDKQPTVRGRVPIKMPEIGRYLKHKEPSIGQMKTSESENNPNSSTTTDPKNAR
jgi:hypothetical protein